MRKEVRKEAQKGSAKGKKDSKSKDDRTTPPSRGSSNGYKSSSPKTTGLCLRTKSGSRETATTVAEQATKWSKCRKRLRDEAASSNAGSACGSRLEAWSFKKPERDLAEPRIIDVRRRAADGRVVDDGRPGDRPGTSTKTTTHRLQRHRVGQDPRGRSNRGR